MELASKRLIFVTGKGGVGKSVCAAAVAWREASKGRRVCLVELGNQSFYESFFETRGIGYEPSEVIPHVHISLFNSEDCLREYVLHYLKLSKLYEIFFQNRVMKAFLNAAPALGELSILGKLTSDVRGVLRTDYDVVVVDCYSTGHAMALLRAARGLGGIFRNGPLAEQAHDIDGVISNPEVTHYVLVTLPEELPVNEAGELYQQLKKEFNADITVVCNRLLCPPVPQSSLDEMTRATDDRGLKEFIAFLKVKSSIQAAQLKRLQLFSPTYFGVPQILRSLNGQDVIEKFAINLEKSWAWTNS